MQVAIARHVRICGTAVHVWQPTDTTQSVGVAAGIAGAAIGHRVTPAPTDDPSVDDSRMAPPVTA